jgi:hypothetical protein
MWYERMAVARSDDATLSYRKAGSSHPHPRNVVANSAWRVAYVFRSLVRFDKITVSSPYMVSQLRTAMTDCMCEAARES